MPRYRDPETIDPYVRQLMDEAGCDTPKEYSLKTGIPLYMLMKLCDGPDGFGREIKNLIEMAGKAGKTPAEFLSGFLSKEAV